MNQSLKTPDKSILIRDVFNSEVSVMNNGGTCVNVDFSKGYAHMVGTGYVYYGFPVPSISAFSLRARVRLASVSAYNIIASFDNVDTIELRTEINGELIIYVGSTKILSTKVLEVGQWYDIVVTRTSAGAVLFYVNNVVYPGATQSTTFYNKALTIGKRGASSSFYFTGDIDLVEYYNRALSATEIKFMYNNWTFRPVNEYSRRRVTEDSGEAGLAIDYLKLIRFYKQNGRWDKIKLCLVPFLGLKQSSGLADKLYDLKGNLIISNDSSQSTTGSKPRVVGNIAPNESLAIYNGNGETRFMTHPEISFAANEDWTAVVMLNLNTISNNYIKISSDAGDSLWFQYANNQIRFYSNIGGDVIGNYVNYNGFGKNVLIHVIRSGNTINLAVNSVFGTPKITTHTGNIIFNKVLNVSSSYPFFGYLHFYSLQSGAMTAQQVEDEYNLLRGWIPEIESVQIGSKIIATSNARQVASANGTVIVDGNLTGAWTPGTAAWCNHTNTTISSWAGKLYNKAARDVLKANLPAGWHIMTEAEATALAALGGNALKYAGTTHWATTGGTNSSGFTALGSSYRNADGSFGTILETAKYWCADSDKVLVINHDSNTATVEAVASVNDGYSIRLVKD